VPSFRAFRRPDRVRVAKIHTTSPESSRRR
jgi:hypothetical protein